MRRTVIPAVIVACLLLGSSRAASADSRWIRVDTPNFIVVGTGGERHLANIGAQFEGFREALTRLVSKTAASSPVPAVVIVFPDDRSFAPFRPTYEGKTVNVGGLYASQAHINYILLGPAHASDDDLRGLFHEFTHLVIANTSPGIPLWLNEGLAEYYSSFQIDDDGREVVIGRSIDSHLHVLARERWIPLSQLIATDQSSSQYNESARRGMFYAESWALVHMLLEGTPDRSSELAEYVDETLAGVPASNAWARAFTHDDVFTSLRQYVERPVLRSHRYVLPARLEAGTATQVEFPDADRVAIFDDVMVALGRKPPAPARRLSSSRDWFDDYMFASALFANGVPAEQSDRLAALAALDRVLAVRGDLLHALYMCGILDDVTGRDPPRAVEYLRKVHRAVPARDDYSLAFAEALARSGDFANAKAVAQDVIDHPHVEGMKPQAIEVLRAIVAAERQSR
jgi:hypothetical protein